MTTANAATVVRKSPGNWLVVKGLLFVFGWLYIFVHLFVADTEAVWLHRAGFTESWVLYVRIFIWTLLLALIWTWSGNRGFFIGLVEFCLFPVAFLFVGLPAVFAWLIPRSLFRSGNTLLGVLYVNGLVTRTWYLRTNMLKYSIVLLAVAAAAFGRDEFVLWTAIAVLILYVVSMWVRRIRIALNPMRLFDVYGKALHQTAPDFHLPNISDAPETMNERERKAMDRLDKLGWFNELERQLTTQSQKLKNVTRQRVYFTLTFTSALVTLVVSMLLIWLANSALYRISPDHFFIGSTGSKWSFFEYTLYTVSLRDDVLRQPASGVAMALYWLAPLVVLLAASYLVVLYVRVTSKRYRETVDQFVDRLHANLHRVKYEIAVKVFVPMNIVFEFWERYGNAAKRIFGVFR